MVEMKVLMKPIEMVARFSVDGSPYPVKYRVDSSIVKVEQVLSTKEEKLAGNRMLIFQCQSEIEGKLKPYELKFELQTCKWFLFKM